MADHTPVNWGGGTRCSKCGRQWDADEDEPEICIEDENASKQTNSQKTTDITPESSD